MHPKLLFWIPASLRMAPEAPSPYPLDNPSPPCYCTYIKDAPVAGGERTNRKGTPDTPEAVEQGS